MTWLSLFLFLLIYGPGIVAAAGGGYDLLSPYGSTGNGPGEQLFLCVSIVAGVSGIVLGAHGRPFAAFLIGWVGCFALLGWGASAVLNEVLRS